jgi:predicted MFS family arabinose efflux permease
MLADGFVMLCIARLAVGVSGGVIQAIVYATTTLRSNKDRTFAVLNIAILVWGAVSLGGLPPLLAAFGTSAVFAGFVALSVASLAIAGRMPQRAPALLRPTLGERAAPIGRHGALLLVLFVLLFAGHGVLWVYQERIGKAIGISPEHIGLILGLSVLSGAVGAALAGVVGARISQRTAQMISFVGAIVATLIMVYGHDIVAYTSTACILMLVWFFGLTYMMAFAAETDVSGRLPGLANAAIFVGQGLGPAIGALAVGEGNFRNVGWAAAAIYAVGVVIAWLVTARAARTAAAAVGQTPEASRQADQALCH